MVMLLVMRVELRGSKERNNTARSLMLSSARTDCVFYSAVGVK